MNKVTMQFSGESRLADIRACLDSYGLSVSKDGLPFLQCTLHYLELGDGGPFDNPNATIDESLNLRMIRYEPPVDEDFLDGIRERHTRWPFFVKDHLTILFRLGDQWWQYDFSPGKTYVERHIDP